MALPERLGRAAIATQAACHSETSQRQLVQPAVASAILCVAEHGCQWSGLPQAIRQLALHLLAHDSLSQGWHVGQRLCPVAARASGADQDRSRVAGKHRVKVLADDAGAPTKPAASYLQVPRRMESTRRRQRDAQKTWALFRSCCRCALALKLGSTTAPCTSATAKASACSVGSLVIGL